MNMKTKFKPVVLNPKDGSSVSVAEHQGRIEVVLEHGGQRCRLLGDKDGIHIGTIVPVAQLDRATVS